MKRLVLVLLIFLHLPTASASADWRWVTPKLKVKKVKPVCAYEVCKKAAKIITKANHKLRVMAYNHRKLNEWRMWTGLPIPDCTWYGESGTGPEYAKARYVMPNATGSGALGKYQLMPSTYSANAKYGDWSPLDQEIAARREYWRHGVSPWQRCTAS